MKITKTTDGSRMNHLKIFLRLKSVLLMRVPIKWIPWDNQISKHKDSKGHYQLQYYKVHL